MTIRIYGREPKTVFGLSGLDENSATFALGWALERSPRFRNTLIESLIGKPTKQDVYLIDLQQHSYDRGFTDIEIRCPGCCHIIIEAKRNWALPTSEQLSRYHKRLASSHDASGLMVSISAASKAYAETRLPSKIFETPLVHYSWTDVAAVVLNAYRQSSAREEKQLLRELNAHLQEYAIMRNPKDNMVYVVSLSPQSISERSSYTWIDVVTKDGYYFHPLAKRWPVVPPNYLGFRYDGRLQSVHHVESCRIVGNLSSISHHWPDEANFDHYLYKLGTAMRPAHEMRTGKVFRNGRVSCAIDTLLSGEFDTISDAHFATNRRLSDESQLET